MSAAARRLAEAMRRVGERGAEARGQHVATITALSPLRLDVADLDLELDAGDVTLGALTNSLTLAVGDNLIVVEVDDGEWVAVEALGPVPSGGGPPGPTGATGPQGPAGITWRGPWAAATAYVVGDGVSYLGSSYRRLVAGTTAGAPAGDATNWTVLAGKGDTGATGATGPTGATGATGATGSQGIQGLPGLDGKTVRNGAGAPSGGLGVDGDFYIDTTASSIYGPKTSGAWGSPTSLLGPGGSSPAGAAGGDLAGSYPNPTIGGTHRASFPFASGWFDYADAGGSNTYERATYSRMSRLVVVHGSVSKSPGAPAAGDVIGTLPAGFRPAVILRFAVTTGATGGTFGTVEVDSTGEIRWMSGSTAAAGGAPNRTDLTGMTFMRA